MDDIEVFKQIFPDKYFYEFWLSDRRPDGRAFTQLRSTCLTRSGVSGFVANAGTNILQTSYEVQNTKVRINTDAKTQADFLYEKINITFTQEADFPLFASCADHLKRLIVRKYAAQLSALKINERISIEVSALCNDASALGLALFCALIALYDCFRAKLEVDVQTVELLLPVLIRAHYIKEQDALLWLFDPTKDELSAQTAFLPSALYLSVVNTSDNKATLEKLQGTDAQYTDLHSLASLVSAARLSGIREQLLKFMLDGSPTQYRVIN